MKLKEITKTLKDSKKIYGSICNVEIKGSELVQVNKITGSLHPFSNGMYSIKLLPGQRIHVEKLLTKNFKTMKVHISGKITGLNLDTAREHFSRVGVLIKRMDYTPVNVMEIVPYNPTWEWHEYMKESIGLLLRCDGIFMLSNWKDSKGACVEHAIAKELGLRIFYEKITS